MPFFLFCLGGARYRPSTVVICIMQQELPIIFGDAVRDCLFLVQWCLRSLTRVPSLTWVPYHALPLVTWPTPSTKSAYLEVPEHGP